MNSSVAESASMPGRTPRATLDRPSTSAQEVGWLCSLAARGWQVTGVDNVPRALERAPKPIEWLLRPDEHWYRLRRD